MVVGKSKGRVLRHMQDRYLELIKHAETKAQGYDLKAHWEDFSILHDHRTGQFDPTLSQDDILARMAVYQKHFKVIPAVVSQALLLRAFDTARLEQRWADVAHMLNPWKEDALFKPENPMLHSLPRHDTWKALTCRTTWFKETVVPLLYDGQGAEDNLKKCVTAMKDELEQVDMLLMEEESHQAHYADAKQAVNALWAMVVMPI